MEMQALRVHQSAPPRRPAPAAAPPLASTSTSRSRRGGRRALRQSRAHARTLFNCRTINLFLQVSRAEGCRVGLSDRPSLCRRSAPSSTSSRPTSRAHLCQRRASHFSRKRGALIASTSRSICIRAGPSRWTAQHLALATS
eukprot:scaffold82230_cov73-Phaeocystis_antarctica.AAC.4